MAIPSSIEEAKKEIDKLRDQDGTLSYPISAEIMLDPIILPDGIMVGAQEMAYVLWGYAQGFEYKWEECPNKSYWWDQVYTTGLEPNAQIANAEDLGAYNAFLIGLADTWVAPVGAILNTGDIHVGDTLEVQVTAASNWPVSVADSGTQSTRSAQQAGDTVSFIVTEKGDFEITLTDALLDILITTIAYTVKESVEPGNAPTAEVMNTAPIYAGSMVAIKVTAADNWPVYVIDDRNGSQLQANQANDVVQFYYNDVGDFTVTVQDSVNLKTTVLTVTVTSPAAPTFTLTSKDLTATCTITASQHYPVNIGWGDGNTGQVTEAGGFVENTYRVAGTYTVTVTDSINGNSAQDKVTVTAPVAPTFSVAKKVDLTATVTMESAENLPVTVDWGDGTATDTIATATGTKDHTYASASTYTVKVTDASNGQSTSHDVTVTAPVAPVFDTSKVDLTVTVTATSAENFPVTIEWGDGQGTDTIAAASGTKDHTYASAQTYQIKVTDASNGQFTTKDVIVTAPVAPDFSVTNTDLTATVTVNSAENFPVTVDWGDSSATDTIDAAAGTKDHTYASANTYTVTVTDASNAQATTHDITVTAA